MAKVAVIGSGFVGRAWAISFARAGNAVALWDQDKDAPAKALAYIEKLLPELEANDLLNGAAASEVATRIHPATTLESASAIPFQSFRAFTNCWARGSFGWTFLAAADIWSARKACG